MEPPASLDPVPATPVPIPPAAPAPAAPGDTGRARRPGQDDVTSALRAPFLRPLLSLPLKKIAIWGGFLALLWLMRQFFGVIFLTFVLSYIAATVVGIVAPRFSSRRVPVVLVFGGLVGAIVGLGFASVPALRRNLEKVRDRVDRGGDPGHMVEQELATALTDYPRLRALHEWLISQGLGAGELIKDALAKEEVKKELVELLQGVIKGLWTGVLTVVMSLVFAFMIVWDAPRLSQGVEQLKHTRLGEVWLEVAPSIATFARLLGRAFEAQSMIATVNTTLTAGGMFLLGIPPSAIGFLSIIVFVCSFVPIVGVWASTLPICVVALQTGGPGAAVGVVLMVVVVHVIEAYVLNPRIYGAHMKVHPVVVLMVLYIGEQALGLWGLILGVPLATYVWRHLILGEAEYVYPPLTRALVSAQQGRSPGASGAGVLPSGEDWARGSGAS